MSNVVRVNNKYFNKSIKSELKKAQDSLKNSLRRRSLKSGDKKEKMFKKMVFKLKGVLK